MALQIILLLNLLAYSFIISQSLSYIIALDDVQRKMQPAAYITFRQLVDKNFRAKFKYPFYASLLFSPASAVLALTYNNYFLFVSAIIATIAIVIDTIITIKKNMPVNDYINQWTIDNYPANWQEYRTKWLYYFRWRQIINITGFIVLLIGVIFH